MRHKLEEEYPPHIENCLNLIGYHSFIVKKQTDADIESGLFKMCDCDLCKKALEKVREYGEE